MPTIPPGVKPIDLSEQVRAAQLAAEQRAEIAARARRVWQNVQAMRAAKPPENKSVIPAGEGSYPMTPALGERDFGPGFPLKPRYGPDSPEGQGGPRIWQYPVSSNIITSPRREDPRLTPFEQLANLVDLYDVAQIAIATRIEQVQGMDFQIVAKNKREQVARQDECDEVTRFFRKPDGITDFGSWIAASIRDHFVFDAVTFFPRPDRSGDLHSLEVIHGPTIKPLLDDRGRTMAYQQILWGYPFSDFRQNVVRPDGEYDDFPTFSPAELMYKPRYTRSWTPYGSPPSEWIILRVNQALRKQYSDLAWFCYDDQTEILTKDRGWVMFPDLQEGEEVATRSPAGEFEWQKPDRYNVQPFDDEMMHFKNRVVDLMVTPNHRMLVRKKYQGKDDKGVGDWHIQRADEFLKGDGYARFHEMPGFSTWTGEEIEVKHLVSPPALKEGRAAGDVDIPAEAWMKFLGIYLAEGCVINHHGYDHVAIAQAPHSEKFSEIEAALKATGLKWTYNDKSWKFLCYHRALAAELHNYGSGAENKFIPNETKGYSARLLALLVDGMMLGDGTVQDGSRVYSTVSEALANDLQEVIQKCGGNASVLYREPKSEKYPGAWGKRPFYIVVEKQALTHEVPVPVPTPYKGNIYCVAVPNGIIYVRRNGKAIWCGNTDGNIPEMLVTLSDPSGRMTPEQVEAFERWFNAVMSGDETERRKMRFVPYGTDIKELRPFSYTTELDLWMLQITCAAFSVPPQELGFTQDVNRATAELQEAVNERRGLKPLTKWYKDIFDDIIQTRLGVGWRRRKRGATISRRGAPTKDVQYGFEGLAWQWSFGDKTDQQTVANTYQTYISAEVLSPDEVRAMVFSDQVEGPSPATRKAQAEEAKAAEEAAAAEAEAAAPPPSGPGGAGAGAEAEAEAEGGAEAAAPAGGAPGGAEAEAEAGGEEELAVSEAGAGEPGVEESLVARATPRRPAFVPNLPKPPRRSVEEVELDLGSNLRQLARQKVAKSAGQRRQFSDPGVLADILFGQLYRDVALANASEAALYVTKREGWAYDHERQEAEVVGWLKRHADASARSIIAKLSHTDYGRDLAGPVAELLDEYARSEVMWAANYPVFRAVYAANVMKGVADVWGNAAVVPPLHKHCRCRGRIRRIFWKGDEDLINDAGDQQIFYAARPTLRKADDADHVYIGVWWTREDEKVCKKPFRTPFGTVMGCKALHDKCVTKGPLLGKQAPPTD